MEDFSTSSLQARARRNEWSTNCHSMVHQRLTAFCSSGVSDRDRSRPVDASQRPVRMSLLQRKMWRIGSKGEEEDANDEDADDNPWARSWSSPPVRWLTESAKEVRKATG